MEKRYTPGPWAFEIDDECDWIYTTETPEDGGDIICMPPDTGNSYKKWPANRALIAAAPTMAAYIQRRADEGDTEAQEILKSI